MNTSQPLSFDPYDFSQTEISGIPVYYKNLPWAPCVHVYISFNVGAFHDPVGKEGLSHFLEHMIFDGSSTLPDRKAVREWSKREALNSWNAYTSHYNTAYHLRCLPEKFEPVFKMIKEQIFSPLLRDVDVEHERKVITQEAWGYYQNEKLLNYIREFTQKVFPHHSLSRVSSALGWPDTVASISADEIRAWHATHYHTGTMSIVLAGNINESILEMMHAICLDIPHKGNTPPLQEVIPTPEIQSIIKTADEIGLIKEQVEIALSGHKNKPLYPSEHDRSFTNLLKDILHEKMRDEKSLCYGVHVSTSRTTDYVSFSVDVKTSEEHIDTVKEIIDTEINTILKTDTCKDRFDQIQKTTLEQIRASEHESDEIVSGVVSQITRNKRIKTMVENISNRENMTFEDMQQAGLYLTDPAYRVVEIILPSKKN